jgi:hypothetical protein
MRKVVNVLAIAMLITGISRTPTSADVDILPTIVNVTEGIHGVRAANWGAAVALGGTLHFQQLLLILRKDGPLLMYSARVSRLAPKDSVIHVDLFSGTDSVGTLDFGKWSHDCSTRHEQRRVTGAPVDFASFDAVDRARIYINGSGWTNCATN